MSFKESLHDVAIRERQLEAHILRSTEYLRRADQDLKRQVSILYLAIAALIILQGIFSFRSINQLAISGILFVTGTSFLAIVNCLLLIKTKTWLRRLNEDWLAPQEKSALEALKLQRNELITRLPRSRPENGNAELN